MRKIRITCMVFIAFLGGVWGAEGQNAQPKFQCSKFRGVPTPVKNPIFKKIMSPFLDVGPVLIENGQFTPTFSIRSQNVTKDKRVIMCAIFLWQGDATGGLPSLAATARTYENERAQVRTFIDAVRAAPREPKPGTDPDPSPRTPPDPDPKPKPELPNPKNPQDDPQDDPKGQGGVAGNPSSGIGQTPPENPPLTPSAVPIKNIPLVLTNAIINFPLLSIPINNSVLNTPNTPTSRQDTTKKLIKPYILRLMDNKGEHLILPPLKWNKINFVFSESADLEVHAAIAFAVIGKVMPTRASYYLVKLKSFNIGR
jgi:hypothetical protein